MTKQPVRLRSTDVSWEEVDDTVVILDLQSSRYLEVNRTGGVLLGLLADGTTVEAMAQALQGRYAVDAERALTDAGAFVDLLSREGLLEKC